MTEENLLGRTYLYVPYEEYGQLKALGAHFDDQRKVWYINPDQDREKFKRWLGEAEPGAPQEYVIESDDAFVARAKTHCWKCSAEIEVICLYCESGKVDGEPYRQFTVSNITSMDEALERQLKPWKHYRKVVSEEYGDGECYVNHCPKCAAQQIDFLLHCEPSGPFFTLKEAEPGLISLTPLKGRIQVNGDEGFEP